MSLKSSMYINRELSWLEFNQRVLDEANDESIPLLERLKFLAITASNLDEFFMVRVGGLQMLCDEGSTKCDPAGMTPQEQLDAISRRMHQMVLDQYACFKGSLEQSLAEAGVCRIRAHNLNAQQFAAVEHVFENEIFAVQTPMAVSASDEFPVIANQSMNVCVRLKPTSDDEEPRMAIIPLARNANRFITLPSNNGYDFVLLEDAVSFFIDRFFPGEEIAESVPFRITRNADLSVREDMAADLLAGMEKVLDARKQSHCVRLEIADKASKSTLEFLQSALHVPDDDTYRIRGPLDLSAFMRLAGLPGFDELKYETWTPRPSPDVDLRSSMFDVLQQKDVLLYVPYESFEPVVRLIEEAAEDADVLAIKIILYRTSRNSPIVAALRRAADLGKHVTAIVELKARFDEARNIEWAKELEHAGVQVIYGVKGLKTHAKVCIIIRRETHGIRRYVHFGTGNYNEVTAKLYTDTSLMTCSSELAADATAFFNAICGYSQPQQFRKIEMAPIGIRDRVLELIEAETQRKQQGQPASIMAQLNSLADPKVIEALYKASQAGVEIDLNIRGICCLRPGVKNVSDNINVVSIIDRYLEHSRIMYFHHGGDELVFISSADWMPRNLDKRVELLVPVDDPHLRERLINVLKSYSQDNVKGRKLTSSGGYRRLKSKSKRQRHRNQEHLYQLACDVDEQKEQTRATTFEPHRSVEND